MKLHELKPNKGSKKNRNRKPTVILGRGEVKTALTVKAHRVSSGARAKIEAAGGSVEIID
jgi:large subunit ribosomal protein L15